MWEREMERQLFFPLLLLYYWAILSNSTQQLDWMLDEAAHFGARKSYLADIALKSAQSLKQSHSSGIHFFSSSVVILVSTYTFCRDIDIFTVFSVILSRYVKNEKRFSLSLFALLKCLRWLSHNLRIVLLVFSRTREFSMVFLQKISFWRQNPRK